MKKPFAVTSKILFASIIASFVVAITPAAEARTLPAKYPRLANYFLKPSISDAEAISLAKWDVVIIGLEIQYNSPNALRILRERHPDIIILAYIASEEIPNAYELLTDPAHPHYQFRQGVADGWWLRDEDGNRFGSWPGTRMMNVTNNAQKVNGKRWNTYLPQFMHDTVMSTGYWDGIFYDNVWPDIAWMNGGNIDSDRNGMRDNANLLDAAWREGMTTLLSTSRSLEGDDAIIIGNGGGRYYTVMNGRLIEEFPSEFDGGWPGAMELYRGVDRDGRAPSLTILNGISATNLPTDYQSMRYTLASALMLGGYASFDEGVERHAALWWYDEYQVALGAPQAHAYNITRPTQGAFDSAVWRRDFDNGIVMVNPTNVAQRVSLFESFERIGTSRSATESNIINTITLAPKDGIILLRRQNPLAHSNYINGAFARVFDIEGNTNREGFFSYSSEYGGGAEIINADIDNNGSYETVVGGSSAVEIYTESGSLLRRFYPYGQGYFRGVNIALGDVNGDGVSEIMTGTGPGAAPHVRLFSVAGTPLNPGFFAYAKTFRGGVNVAAGDFDGNGKDEIITGAGRGGGPQVRVFSSDGTVLGQFFAYDKAFRGGVDITAGDINADGIDEIVTGAGPGGGPHVRIFASQGRLLSPGFFAFDPGFRGGITVGIGDPNLDHVNEIIVSAISLY